MAEKLTSGDILSAEQLEKSFKIYAGPGAGKTHFLVENVKSIVSTDPHITNSKSRKVVCITYTNAAVNEIKRRLAEFSDYVEADTIHGFIIENIIKPFQQTLIDVVRLDFGLALSSNGVISSQLEGVGILHGIDREDIYSYVRSFDNGRFKDDTIAYSKKIMGEVQVNNKSFVNSILYNTTFIPGLVHSKQIKCGHDIAIKCFVWDVVRKLTHDEILYFGYRVLQSNPAALFAIRVKFPFIFVDEFQDTNPLQTLLLKLIGEKSTRIGVVGDLAQSIYSFQGAKPSDFLDFFVHEGVDQTYTLEGNRRSTKNIINFCNFIRQSDETIQQKSVKVYPGETSKRIVESKPVHFLLGTSPHVKAIIASVIDNGGVILTRTWAAAFNYIQNISDSQAKLLSKIYNSYYSTSIQIREEITDQNNVTWVKAFRFIFSFYASYSSGSFINIVKAIRALTDIDIKLLTPRRLFEFDKLANNIFSSITPNTLTVAVIEKFNEILGLEEYRDIRQLLNSGESFSVTVFDEQDSEERISAISGLEWDTSIKLFNEVFAENSKYMTVHQAKGQEWDSVVVSLSPTRSDGVEFSKVFSNPTITAENSSDEFIRMFYVACSRAIQDLYLHIGSGCTREEIQRNLATFIEKTHLNIDYELIE